MGIPKNCTECPYTSICPAPHYGGSRCRYENTISRKTIEGFLKTLRPLTEKEK